MNAISLAQFVTGMHNGRVSLTMYVYLVEFFVGWWEMQYLEHRAIRIWPLHLALSSYSCVHIELGFPLEFSRK